jgi:hypothetical protein
LWYLREGGVGGKKRQRKQYVMARRFWFETSIAHHMKSRGCSIRRPLFFASGVGRALGAGASGTRRGMRPLSPSRGILLRVNVKIMRLRKYKPLGEPPERKYGKFR